LSPGTFAVAPLLGNITTSCVWGSEEEQEVSCRCHLTPIYLQNIEVQYIIENFKPTKMK